MRPAFTILVSCFVLAGMAAAASAAEAPAAGPVTIREVAKMIQNKTTPARIMEIIRELGMTFKITADRAEKLKKVGFTEEQIQELKLIEQGKVAIKPKVAVSDGLLLCAAELEEPGEHMGEDR